MRYRLCLAALALVVIGAATPPAATAQETPRVTVEVEAGPVWQSRNDAQIPNDQRGTRFSVRDVVGSGPWPAGRLYLTWHFNERHSLRALAAPLSITETGVLGGSVGFAGATYQPAVPVQATYKFNSYRLTYRYRYRHGTRATWWIGVTAKIRDANIELHQGSTTSRKTDVGFVPLAHVGVEWRVAPRWRVIGDLDALAGGPGRAEDLALKVGYAPGERWTLAAGYRTVEGGAAVDAVYTFAWLHYAVASLAYRF